MTHDSVGEVGIIFQLETFVSDWVQEASRDKLDGGRNIFGQILERMSSENNPSYPRAEDLPPVSREKIRKDSTDFARKQPVSHSFWERRRQGSTTFCDVEIQMSREKLPAWSVRNMFLELIRDNLVDICFKPRCSDHL
jgi:hypothetical protein